MPLDSAILEAQLFRIFQIAAHWGALLLLDEADVFLERRSRQNLPHNSLVSVFLRKLEYYEGIMFLTTNRAEEFDPEILSRIHLMLRYENPITEARRNIWANFLQKAITPSGEAHIFCADFDRLITPKLTE